MKKAEKELEIILNDTVHGSSELLNYVFDHVLIYKTDIAYLKKAANKVKARLSHFPVIINFIKEFESILERKRKYTLTNFIKTSIKKKNETYEKLFIKAFKVLSKHKTVLTISHSKTLVKIFELWKKYDSDLKVIVCESRPNCEGIIMAEQISNLNIQTESISEGMSGNLIKEVDAVILGADQILSNGNIINKTGSRMLAVLANYQKIPVYVLASSDKMVKNKIVNIKKVNQSDNARLRDKKIKFRNEDFEEIEKLLITKIFTS